MTTEPCTEHGRDAGRDAGHVALQNAEHVAEPEHSPFPFQLSHLPPSGVWQYTGHGLKRTLARPQPTVRNVTPGVD